MITASTLRGSAGRCARSALETKPEGLDHALDRGTFEVFIKSHRMTTVLWRRRRKDDVGLPRLEVDCETKQALRGHSAAQHQASSQASGLHGDHAGVARADEPHEWSGPCGNRLIPSRSER